MKLFRASHKKRRHIMPSSCQNMLCMYYEVKSLCYVYNIVMTFEHKILMKCLVIRFSCSGPISAHEKKMSKFGLKMVFKVPIHIMGPHASWLQWVVLLLLRLPANLTIASLPAPWEKSGWQLPTTLILLLIQKCVTSTKHLSLTCNTQPMKAEHSLNQLHKFIQSLTFTKQDFQGLTVTFQNLMLNKLGHTFSIHQCFPNQSNPSPFSMSSFLKDQSMSPPAIIPQSIICQPSQALSELFIALLTCLTHFPIVFDHSYFMCCGKKNHVAENLDNTVSKPLNSDNRHSLLLPFATCNPERDSEYSALSDSKIFSINSSHSPNHNFTTLCYPSLYRQGSGCRSQQLSGLLLLLQSLGGIWGIEQALEVLTRALQGVKLDPGSQEGFRGKLNGDSVEGSGNQWRRGVGVQGMQVVGRSIGGGEGVRDFEGEYGTFFYILSHHLHREKKKTRTKKRVEQV
ncbi:hypothetical protein VP01_2895g1 [Puccinia sorghi]|uniref:Uncharacterized protein n=1 Tax=Puccinia sorghi TaxID=27349 RepID=A0A0L6V298_9BASI|nr:hypothetical protein VP01_2895g1 [Puccinia sorghi]